PFGAVPRAGARKASSLDVKDRDRALWRATSRSRSHGTSGSAPPTASPPPTLSSSAKEGSLASLPASSSAIREWCLLSSLDNTKCADASFPKPNDGGHRAKKCVLILRR
ncbi:unnamed protein product, partial [Ixodes persulcatus]